jgi:hypothetical protein
MLSRSAGKGSGSLSEENPSYRGKMKRRNTEGLLLPLRGKAMQYGERKNVSRTRKE